MGNCTSKKSKKFAKLSAAKKPIFRTDMDKQQDTHTKGLSIKIAPFTKGEVTSFGFKKKPPSQLPVPVTLTSNGHLSHEANEKPVQSGVKNINDGCQSGSSVESLCHAQYRSTPKMIRKRDLVKQTLILNSDAPESNSINVNNAKNIKYTLQTTPTYRRNSGTSENDSKQEQAVNRFGFRQSTPPRLTENCGKASKNNAINRAIFLTGQDPYESGLYGSKKSEVSLRSRSEGPRERFFKQTLQTANSIQSDLNHSKTSLSSGSIQPGKFTFQTSHLPRPQFAVRMSDPKAAKGIANNYRKGGPHNDLNSSKESSATEDSGFESYSSANNTLEKQILILDCSPGAKVRRRLPTFKGKKLEMKVVGNKFELLKKDEENSPDVVTEVSLIKLPTPNVKTNATIINTGLVEQRTNQYLKKIQRPFGKTENGVHVKLLAGTTPKPNSKEMIDSNIGDENLAVESEEEKLCKDSRKSEKSSVKYLMSDGCGDGDDILPGEAMAEDLSLCLSFEEETSSDCTKNLTQRPSFQPDFDETPNTIRLDALKLSKEIKYKVNSAGISRKSEKVSEFLNDCEKDEDTFPSDSILEQLSELDSIDEKREKKHIAKEKLAEIVSEHLDKEDLGIDLNEEENASKSDTDIDDNDLELNLDDKEIKDDNKNCLDSASPDSPGTPTHASNSLSISDGRDFLIDDEIADQPQLCLSESYVECSCQEEGKTSNEKPVTGSEFVTCCDGQGNTVENENEIIRNGKEVEKVDVKCSDKPVYREIRARLNSEGTLSPCDSIASDDLMLDFETNSFEETGRFDGENAVLENATVNRNEMKEVSNQRLSTGSGGCKSLKSREGSSNCSSPVSKKIEEISSPLRSSVSTPFDDDSIRLDKISYQNMFEDISSMKSMLLKLKRLLLESEGGLQENGRIYLEDGTVDNIVEEELTDLRRQVLFLQQQLEEREKTVQILRLEVNKSCESKAVPAAGDNRKQTNAATQTGLDQFQQDFPHFRIFQSTPVV